MIDARKSSDVCTALCKRTIHASALMSTNKGNLLTAAGSLD